MSKCALLKIVSIIGILTFTVSVNASRLPPSCKRVLDEKTFALVPSQPGQGATFNYSYVFQKSGVLQDACEITYDQGLRIGLGKITKISDVLIGQAIIEKRMPNSIEVFIIKGGSSLFKCGYSGYLDVSSVTYVKYSCPMNGFANALEIRSVAPWTIDLTDVKTHGSLGWLVVRQNDRGCQPPGIYPGQSLSPIKQFYLPEDEVIISCKEDLEIVSSDTRNCSRAGYWSGEPPICQPKEKWYISDIFLNKQTVAAGMQNVSFVVSFNRNFNNIRKIGFGFEIALNESETIRTLHNNFEFTIWSLNSSIYQYSLTTIHFGDDAALENFAHTINDMAGKQLCLNCQVLMTFSKYHWDVPILKFVSINAASNFESGEEYLELSKGCPPLDPYLGMPHEYSNYELVLNVSINELLRETPCREGFKFQGNKDDISSCSNGKWKGKGFPVCEAVRTKSPPEVNGATWNYLHDDAFHEVIYACENGQNIIANYDLIADDWTENIECHKGAFQLQLLVIDPKQLTLLPFIVGAAFCVTWFCVRHERNKQTMAKVNQLESSKLMYLHYATPISKGERSFENAQEACNNSKSSVGSNMYS